MNLQQSWFLASFIRICRIDAKFPVTEVFLLLKTFFFYFPPWRLLLYFFYTMALLMTESFGTMDCTTRKRRRVSTDEPHSNTMAAKSKNPVNQPDPINMIAPDFNCAAVLHHQIVRCQLTTVLLQHKAIVLFFYECDL